MAGSRKASNALMARLAEDSNYEKYILPKTLNSMKGTTWRRKYQPFIDQDRGMGLLYAINWWTIFRC
jgi:hypothetical protein